MMGNFHSNFLVLVNVLSNAVLVLVLVFIEYEYRPTD